MRDHDPIRVSQFMGLFDRGTDEEVPANYARSASNMQFFNRGVRSRRGFEVDLTDIQDIRRIAIYRIAGQAQRLLILNNNGDIVDSTDVTTVILHVTGMTDFSMVTMFDRAYITPHNGVKGLAGETVYVYDGDGFARAAAGLAPTGFNMSVVDSAVSGSIEEGTHLFAVAFETESGFITGYGGYVALDALGARKADLSDIATGPSGTVARVLVATKIIDGFIGDYINATYYKVPGGRIGDNTSTTATVDFFDADLEDEASRFADQMEEIPAGCWIRNYNGRLAVGGSDTEPSVAYVSVVGEPESIDAEEGLLTVNPGDAGSGLRNAFGHRDSLVLLKSRRCYYTIDTGENAAFWKVIPLDMSVGAEVHTVAQISDYGETLEDIAIVASRSGVRAFNGTFSEHLLTWNIQDWWDRINPAYFHLVEIVIDPDQSHIYIAVPQDDATRPTRIMYGDYSLGLAPDKIRWCEWILPMDPYSIVVDVDVTTEKSHLKFGGYAGGIYKHTRPANNNDNLYDEFDTNPGTIQLAIDAWYEFAVLPHESSDMAEGVYHHGIMQMRIIGLGAFFLQLRAMGSTLIHDSFGGSGDPNYCTLPFLTIGSDLSVGKEVRVLTNMTTERASFMVRTFSIGTWFSITRFTHWVKLLWSEFPA